MGLQIVSGVSADLLTVDPTSKAARVTIYDTAGNVIGGSTNRDAVAETAGGLMLSGKDYKTARTLRASPEGTLRTSENVIYLYDAFEGVTRNLNLWVETVATMTSAQALATGLTLNSGNSVTNAQGILESSNRQFPLISRTALVFRTHLKFTGATNCVEEWGFSDQTSATTALHNNGAFFRRDSAGSLQPVLAFNGTETQGTVMTGPATTQYAWYEIFLEESRATFQILSAEGVILSAQVMEIGSSAGGAGSPTQARMFAVTHINAMMRVYNSGAAGTAPTIIVNQVVVMLVDAVARRDWRIVLSGLGYTALTSPTTYLQLAQFANSADPAAAVLSNTTASYTTLGGKFLGPTPTPAGAVTDFALFAWTNPSPYTFYFEGVKIQVMNRGAAITTTATVLEWGLAFNSSAQSLATAAPYSPMRVDIGRQTFAIGAAIESVPALPEIVWSPATPIAVQPGKFLHVILRIPVGSATAAGFLRGGVAINGFFE